MTLYEFLHAFACYTANSALFSYALPEALALDVCWTSGIGMNFHELSDGGYAESNVHRKTSEGLYIPLSMKVGKWGWSLFGTVTYPVYDERVYQVDDVDVEFVKQPNVDYLIGIGYTL